MVYKLILLFQKTRIPGTQVELRLVPALELITPTLGFCRALHIFTQINVHTYKIFSLKDMVDLFYMNMLVYILDLRYLKFILVLMSAEAIRIRGH